MSTIVPFFLRNKPARYGYPGGFNANPGIDWTHPAARAFSQNRGFAHVVVNGIGWASITDGSRLAATSGTGTATQLGMIGPGILSLTTNNQPYYTINGQDSTAYSGKTFACIFARTASNTGTGSSNGGLVEDNNLNGLEFKTSVNVPNFIMNNTTVATGPTLAASTPYFIVGSAYTGAAFSMVVVNLLTGQIFVTSGTTATTFSTTTLTPYYYGGCSNIVWAAGMYAPVFMPLQQLMAWAQDPWSFWYQDETSWNLAHNTVAAARLSRLTLLGAG